MILSFDFKSAIFCFVFLTYVVLAYAQTVFLFKTGYIDFVILFTILFISFLRPRQLLAQTNRVFNNIGFYTWLTLIVYIVFLYQYSHNQLGLVVSETMSVYKWYLYYLSGFLIAGCYSSEKLLFPSIYLLSAFTGLVLIVTLQTYPWQNINGDIGTLFGFYTGGIPSIFLSRSIFSLFAFVLVFWALNSFRENPKLSVWLFVNSMVFVFASGNRKTLVALVLMMLVARISGKRRNIWRGVKLSFVLLVAILAPQLTIFSDTLVEYSNSEQPRVATYRVAFEIAGDKFPIGSGPGTFASKASMINYSPIYAEYGLEKKWGFRENDEVEFYNDTYWAQVIGQYGYLGVVLTLIIYGHIIWSCKVKDNQLISFRVVLSCIFLMSLVTPSLQRTEVALFLFFPAGMLSFARNRVISE